MDSRLAQGQAGARVGGGGEGDGGGGKEFGDIDATLGVVGGIGDHAAEELKRFAAAGVGLDEGGFAKGEEGVLVVLSEARMVVAPAGQGMARDADGVGDVGLGIAGEEEHEGLLLFGGKIVF